MAVNTGSCRVAYFGDPGSFTHIAVLKHFGVIDPEEERERYLPQGNRMGAVFDAVWCADADYGVAPVENLMQGYIRDTLEELRKAPGRLSICGEVGVAIQLSFASREHNEEDIDVVYCKEDARTQCGYWLRDLQERVPDLEPVPVASSTRAVERASKEARSAAICSERAAKMHGVPVRHRRIEDIKNNRTRFMVIKRGSSAEQRAQDNKTTFLVELEHTPGSLKELFDVLGHEDGPVNVMMIHALPMPTDRKLWEFEYVFFVDCKGHIEDTNVSRAYKELQRAPLCRQFLWLGSYPMTFGKEFDSSADEPLVAGSPGPSPE